MLKTQSKARGLPHRWGILDARMFKIGAQVDFSCAVAARTVDVWPQSHETVLGHSGDRAIHSPRSEIRRRSMKHLLAAILVVIVSALAQPAAAQNEERAVPIVQAPFHVPVFTNEYVTFLSITVPPGANTGYHIHSRDSVSVNIEPADMTNQNFGSSEVSKPARGERGRATFTSYTKDGPRTHKAANVGTTLSVTFRSS